MGMAFEKPSRRTSAICSDPQPERCNDRLTSIAAIVRSRVQEITSAVALHGRRPPLPLGTPAPIEALIKGCWRHVASERPSFVTVQQVRSQSGHSHPLAEHYVRIPPTTGATQPPSGCVVRQHLLHSMPRGVAGAGEPPHDA